MGNSVIEVANSLGYQVYDVPMYGSFSLQGQLQLPTSHLLLDRVKIYERELNPVERDLLYSTEDSTSKGLQSRFTFDGHTKDLVGGHVLGGNGSVRYLFNGKLDKAADLQGGWSTSSILDGVDGGSGTTLNVWVRKEPNPRSDGLVIGINSGTTEGVILKEEQLYFRDKNNQEHELLPVTDITGEYQWSMLTLVINHQITDHFVDIYLDGQWLKRIELDYADSLSLQGGVVFGDTGFSFDDLRVFSRPFSPSEITQFYRQFTVAENFEAYLNNSLNHVGELFEQNSGLIPPDDLPYSEPPSLTFIDPDEGSITPSALASASQIPRSLFEILDKLPLTLSKVSSSVDEDDNAPVLTGTVSLNPNGNALNKLLFHFMKGVETLFQLDRTGRSLTEQIVEMKVVGAINADGELKTECIRDGNCSELGLNFKLPILDTWQSTSPLPPIGTQFAFQTLDLLIDVTANLTAEQDESPFEFEIGFEGTLFMRSSKYDTWIQLDPSGKVSFDPTDPASQEGELALAFAGVCDTPATVDTPIVPDDHCDSAEPWDLFQLDRILANQASFGMTFNLQTGVPVGIKGSVINGQIPDLDKVIDAYFNISLSGGDDNDKDDDADNSSDSNDSNRPDNNASDDDDSDNSSGSDDSNRSDNASDDDNDDDADNSSGSDDTAGSNDSNGSDNTDGSNDSNSPDNAGEDESNDSGSSALADLLPELPDIYLYVNNIASDDFLKLFAPLPGASSGPFAIITDRFSQFAGEITDLEILITSTPDGIDEGLKDFKKAIAEFYQQQEIESEILTRFADKIGMAVSGQFNMRNYDVGGELYAELATNIFNLSTEVPIDSIVPIPDVFAIQTLLADKLDEIENNLILELDIDANELKTLLLDMLASDPKMQVWQAAADLVGIDAISPRQIAAQVLSGFDVDSVYLYLDASYNPPFIRPGLNEATGEAKFTTLGNQITLPLTVPVFMDPTSLFQVILERVMAEALKLFPDLGPLLGPLSELAMQLFTESVAIIAESIQNSLNQAQQTGEQVVAIGEDLLNGELDPNKLLDLGVNSLTNSIQNNPAVLSAKLSEVAIMGVADAIGLGDEFGAAFDGVNQAMSAISDAFVCLFSSCEPDPPSYPHNTAWPVEYPPYYTRFSMPPHNFESSLYLSHMGAPWYYSDYYLRANPAIKYKLLKEVGWTEEQMMAEFDKLTHLGPVESVAQFAYNKYLDLGNRWANWEELEDDDFIHPILRKLIHSTNVYWQTASKKKEVDCQDSVDNICERELLTDNLYSGALGSETFSPKFYAMVHRNDTTFTGNIKESSQSTEDNDTYSNRGSLGAFEHFRDIGFEAEYGAIPVVPASAFTYRNTDFRLCRAYIENQGVLAGLWQPGTDGFHACQIGDWFGKESPQHGFDVLTGTGFEFVEFYEPLSDEKQFVFVSTMNLAPSYACVAKGYEGRFGYTMMKEGKQQCITALGAVNDLDIDENPEVASYHGISVNPMSDGYRMSDSYYLIAANDYRWDLPVAKFEDNFNTSYRPLDRVINGRFDGGLISNSNNPPQQPIPAPDTIVEDVTVVLPQEDGTFTVTANSQSELISELAIASSSNTITLREETEFIKNLSVVTNAEGSVAQNMTFKDGNSLQLNSELKNNDIRINADSSITIRGSSDLGTSINGKIDNQGRVTINTTSTIPEKPVFSLASALKNSNNSIDPVGNFQTVAQVGAATISSKIDIDGKINSTVSTGGKNTSLNSTFDNTKVEIDPSGVVTQTVTVLTPFKNSVSAKSTIATDGRVTTLIEIVDSFGVSRIQQYNSTPGAQVEVTTNSSGDVLFRVTSPVDPVAETIMLSDYFPGI
ncbi:MAG: hypothetical protein HQL48_06475 [Gammaproteobacteria bacterium]|nr:hypothetical protein [Gammaproteobacteria bacterium]